MNICIHRQKTDADTDKTYKYTSHSPPYSIFIFTLTFTITLTPHRSKQRPLWTPTSPQIGTTTWLSRATARTSLGLLCCQRRIITPNTSGKKALRMKFFVSKWPTHQLRGPSKPPEPPSRSSTTACGTRFCSGMRSDTSMANPARLKND